MSPDRHWWKRHKLHPDWCAEACGCSYSIFLSLNSTTREGMLLYWMSSPVWCDRCRQEDAGQVLSNKIKRLWFVCLLENRTLGWVSTKSVSFHLFSVGLLWSSRKLEVRPTGDQAPMWTQWTTQLSVTHGDWTLTRPVNYVMRSHAASDLVWISDHVYMTIKIR